MAGAVSRSFTAPIDRLKVLAQVRGISFRLVSGLVQIAERDGIRSLWRGNGVNFIKIIPEFGSKFTIYELVKLAILELDNTDPLPPKYRFIAGSTAGLFSQTVVYPIEVLKTRMVVQEGKRHERLRTLLARLIEKHGYHGFVRGYTSAAGGIVLFTGVELTTYETLKVFLMSRLELDGILPPPLTVACAIVSCISGQAVAFPLSMASTTVQASDVGRTARGILVERYREHGVRGLYKGATMSFMKAIPAIVITYLTYEHVLWGLGAVMTR